MSAPVTAPAAAAWAVAASVPDPELPFLTVADLGILRGVEPVDGAVVVTVTPTYSGCPAMAEIQRDIHRRLIQAGFERVEVRVALAPPWTTDWITDSGRRKLAAAGVAPPLAAPSPGAPVPVNLGPRRGPVPCPRCASPATTQTSAFGATACTSLYRCHGCGEPFEYVREI
ncbi:MAG TPA: 1,2-phenylacetyl-CoA epoxidase subunit PaaD [Acidimicrobiales bacterium]|nr:1,2-phenylacetyl-CoA epoxidase subunit PaaD [Acidimicrobiales bacterium]